MPVWFVFALMTAAAIFAVLWPLGQAANAQAGCDLAVYRDQLDEIERDRAAGVIRTAEADAARRRRARGASARRGRGRGRGCPPSHCGSRCRGIPPRLANRLAALASPCA